MRNWVNYFCKSPVLFRVHHWLSILWLVSNQGYRRTTEFIISYLSFHKAAKHWTIMVFSIMVLLCLAQNSGVFSVFNQLGASSMSQPSEIGTGLDIDSADSKHKDTELTQCELSEKSLRVCLDEPPLMPLLVLLFILPFIPLVSRVLQRALDTPVLPRPRRIHLSFCRFQE